MATSGFAKAVGSRLLNKRVEIYQGSEHDTVKRAEVDTVRKTVICGKLIDILDDCLVIEIVDGESVAEVYINTISVYSILEVKDEMSIFDIYLPDERKQKK